MLKDRKNRGIMLAAGSILLLSVLFFYPVILQGKTFYAFDILLLVSPWCHAAPGFKAYNTLISDPVNVFYPYYRFLKTALEAGALPLWNGSNFCGLPSGPPSHPILMLLYALLPITVAHDLLLWLHLLGTGLCMFLYLREIGLRTAPALIGSLAWMFNGYVMVWFEFENVPLMAFSLPLTLYILERWMRERTKTLYLLLVTSLSLSIAVHYAHLLIYQFLFVGAYALYRYPGRQAEGDGVQVRSRWRGIAWIFLAFGLSIILNANFLTGHFYAFEGSQRSSFSFQTLFGQVGRLPFKYLVTLLFPDFYGSPAQPVCFTPGGQPYNNYNELCLYGGILPLFLAVATIPFIREKQIGFYWLTALTSITMAMGSPLYYPLARFVPGLNLSTPTRIVYIFGFAFSVLAALGAEVLLGRGTRRKWAILALWTLLLGAGLSLVFLVHTKAGLEWAAGPVPGHGPVHDLILDHFSPLSPMFLRPLILILLSCYLLGGLLFLPGARQVQSVFPLFLVLVLSYDLMSFGWCYNTASPRSLEYPKTGAIQFLERDKTPFRVITYGNFLANSLAPFGIQEVSGYSSFYSRRFGEYLHLSQHGSRAAGPAEHDRWIYLESFGSPLLDLINVKYLVLSPQVHVQSGKLERVYDGEVRIYRNRECFPRLFFVSAYRLQEDAQAAYEAMGRFTAQDFRDSVVLESEPPPGYLRAGGPAEEPVEADIALRAYGPNRVELEVSANRRGFVVMSDTYHPAWQARVDGIKTPVLRANYIMRAIPVPEGEHRVTLLFRPRLLIAGAAITAAGWSILGMLLLLAAGAGIRRRFE